MQDQRGLLPTLDAFCEHGNPEICCKLEDFYIIMPHARSDLSVSFWNNPTIPRSTKLQWLREPLEGIRTMHAMGIMHRDIRPQNILIVSAQPPRASLCDYGKAIEAQTSSMTAIGAIPTCAPEVWTASSSHPYTLQIDLWSYGFAVAQILIFALQKIAGSAYFNENVAITRARHSAILNLLNEHRRMASEDESLVDLVGKLLVWNPEDRWSAEQALQHDCWKPLMQEEEKIDMLEGGLPGAKRRHD